MAASLPTPSPTRRDSAELPLSPFRELIQVVDRLATNDHRFDKLESELAVARQQLDRIESTLSALQSRPASKEWYTTAEVAEMVNRSEYTVREWCRKEQVDGKKAVNGHDWLLPLSEVVRIQNGERPLPGPKEGKPAAKGKEVKEKTPKQEKKVQKAAADSSSASS